MSSLTDLSVGPLLHRVLKQAQDRAPLNPDRERKLLSRLQAGDGEAVDKLVEDNLRCVADAVTMGSGLKSGLGLRDLCAEGIVALVSAVRRYDEDRHGDLRPYVRRRVRRSMLEAED